MHVSGVDTKWRLDDGHEHVLSVSPPLTLGFLAAGSGAVFPRWAPITLDPGHATLLANPRNRRNRLTYHRSFLLVT
jgi:hypothetical protein